MKTTSKGFKNLNSFFNDVHFLINYIEQHEDGKVIKNTIVFEKFKRHALKTYDKMLTDDLI